MSCFFSPTRSKVKRTHEQCRLFDVIATMFTHISKDSDSDVVAEADRREAIGWGAVHFISLAITPTALFGIGDSPGKPQGSRRCPTVAVGTCALEI